MLDAQEVEGLVDGFRTALMGQETGSDLDRRCWEDFALCYEEILGWHLPDYQRAVIPTILAAERLLFLAPPGHFKSTLFAMYAAWRIGRDPSTRIIVATHTLSYSQLLVDLICDITRSPRFIEIFGDLDMRTRGEPNFRFAQRAAFAIKDPTLLALGVGSSTVGPRCDIILCDDVVSRPNSRTPTQRAHVHDWFFGSLTRRRDPPPIDCEEIPIPSQIIVCGARFYNRDLYAELLERPNWVHLVFTADESAPLCSSRYPASRLADEEAQDYFTFQAQFMQDPQDFTVNFLHESWLHFYLETPPLEKLLIYQGCDPNITGTGSAFALATVGMDLLNKRVYILHLVKLTKLSLETKREIIMEQNERWRPLILNLETNSAFKLFGEFLKIEGFLPLDESPSQLDKTSRIAGMATYFRNEQVLLPGTLSGPGRIVPAPWIQPFIKEWRDFPQTHADCLDAVEKALEAAFHLRVKAATGQRPPPSEEEQAGNMAYHSRFSDINVFH